jgi:hypothetical protein
VSERLEGSGGLANLVLLDSNLPYVESRFTHYGVTIEEGKADGLRGATLRPTARTAGM